MHPTKPNVTTNGRFHAASFCLTTHDVDGFTSIGGGKLTTHRQMAEAVADHVCEKLGVEGQCRTADEVLPGHDDPDALNGFVREFAADSPADADVTDTSVSNP